MMNDSKIRLFPPRTSSSSCEYAVDGFHRFNGFVPSKINLFRTFEKLTWPGPLEGYDWHETHYRVGSQPVLGLRGGLCFWWKSTAEWWSLNVFDGIYYDLLFWLWFARLLVSSWICNTLVFLKVNSKDGIIHPWICLESHCLCRWWPARCLPWVCSNVGRSNPFRTSISWCFRIA